MFIDELHGIYEQLTNYRASFATFQWTIFWRKKKILKHLIVNT